MTLELNKHAEAGTWFSQDASCRKGCSVVDSPSTCPICSMYGIFTCIWSFGCNSRIILGCIESKVYDAEDSGRWGFEQKVYGVRWPALSKGGPFCIMHPVCYSLSLSSGRVWNQWKTEGLSWFIIISLLKSQFGRIYASFSDHCGQVQRRYETSEAELLTMMPVPEFWQWH